MGEEKQTLENQPTKRIFRVDNDDIDVSLLVDLLDSLIDPYLKSRNWDANRKEAFRSEYNKIRGKLLSGDISGRGFDRSYLDSKNEIFNDNYKSSSEVFYYMDKILGARKRKNPEEKAKLKKYTNDSILRGFTNRYFGGSNLIDLKAWENEDFDPSTNTYTINHRKDRMSTYLTEYLNALDKQDYDFEGSAYRDKDDLKNRLSNAIEALKGDNYSDELSAIGFGEDFRNKMFRMSREDTQDDNAKFLSLLTEEEKQAWLLIKNYGTKEDQDNFKARILKRGSERVSAINAKLDKENLIKLDEETWNKYLETQKQNIQLSNGIPGFKVTSDINEDMLDLNNLYTNKNINTTQLVKILNNDLISYLNGDPNIHSKIDAYYRNLGLNEDTIWLNPWSRDDFRQQNRSDWYKLWIGNDNSEEELRAMDLQHFANNYKAILNTVQTLITDEETDSPLGPNSTERWLVGMWNPEKFEFYTLDDADNSIKVHKISESKQVLQEFKRQYPQLWNPKKHLQGGTLAQQQALELLQNHKQKFLDYKDDLEKSGKDEEKFEAGQRELEDGLQPEDITRLGALGADITSMVTAFIPVYGTAISGILGVGSTLALMGADIIDDSVSTGEVLKNLAANAGMTVLGMVPGGKTIKIFNLVKKWVPRLIALYGTTATFTNPEIQKSLSKIVSSDSNDNITVDDWKNIGYAISSIAGLTRAGALKFKEKKFSPKVSKTDNVEIQVKVGNEIKPLKITGKQLLELNAAGKEGNDKALSYLSSIIGENADLKDAKLTVDFDKKGLLNKATFGKLGETKVEGTPETITELFKGIEHSKRIIDALNQEAIARGKKYRLSTDYEIFHDGKGFLQNVNPSGNGFAFVSSTDANNRIKQNVNDVELFTNNFVKAKNIKSAKYLKLNLNSARILFPELRNSTDAEILAILNRVSPGKSPVEAILMLDTAIHTKGSPYFNKLVFDISRDMRPKGKGSKPNKKAAPTKRNSFLSDIEAQSTIGKGKKHHYRLETVNGKLTKEALQFLRKLKVDLNSRYKIHENLFNKFDSNPKKVAFLDAIGNVYYWKNGGIIKASGGALLYYGETSEDEKPIERDSGYRKITSRSNYGEFGRMLTTMAHNKELELDRIDSLRRNHYNVHPMQLPLGPNLISSDYGTQKAVDGIRNSVLETADPNLNFLQRLEAEGKVGEAWVQDRILKNKEIIDLTKQNADLALKQAELNYASAIKNEEKNALLGMDIDNTTMARKQKDLLAVDNYLKALNSLNRQKELAAEKAMYNTFIKLQLLKIDMAMEPLDLEYRAWAADRSAKGLDTSMLYWDKYYEYFDKKKQLTNLASDAINKYQADYFGYLYNPLQKQNTVTDYSAPTFYFKKGGKTESDNKRNLEIAKLLQKDISEQVKRSEKKLERLEKLTQKLRNKK